MCVPKWVASEALLSGLVLNLAIDPGVAEIGDLGDDQKVVATERLALVPLALLDHLTALVGLVVVPPEPVDGDVSPWPLGSRLGQTFPRMFRIRTTRTALSLFCAPTAFRLPLFFFVAMVETFQERSHAEMASSFGGTSC